MPRYNIVTLITLKSPLHITDPVPARYIPERDEVRVAYGSEDGFPCTKTKSLPIQVIARRKKDEENEGSIEGALTSRSFPILPGNTVRGLFRRMVARRVLQAVQARNETVSFDMYHILMCGAASASPSSGKTTILDSQRAAEHPVVCLLGGGPRLLWSRYSIGIGFPVHEDLLAANVVPMNVTSLCARGRLTFGDFFSRKDDVQMATGVLPIGVKDLQQSIAAQQERLTQSKENKKKKSDGDGDDKTQKKVDLTTVSATEVVVPGVTFYSEHWVDTGPAGDAVLGLFLLGFLDLAKEQRMGGGCRKGYGRFDLKLVVTLPDGSPVTAISVVDHKHVLNISDTNISKAVEAWTSYASTFSAAKLSHAFLGTTD